MHFLPDVYVTCETCKGKRYNRETLEVLFKGKSIADVLDMTVEDAEAFFAAVPAIREKMTTLMRVGLGYIKVGQQATTLSGGEAQRVKLSKELARRSTGRTLYILDEPTTGLHFEDTRKLLEVLHELVEQGNTVVVIEHNLDVIKTADHIIDIGPEGGDGGGTIVATGTPEADRPGAGEPHRPLSRARSSRRGGWRRSSAGDRVRRRRCRRWRRFPCRHWPRPWLAALQRMAPQGMNGRMSEARKGVLAIVAASAIWGVSSLYYKALDRDPAARDAEPPHGLVDGLLRAGAAGAGAGAARSGRSSPARARGASSGSARC